MLVPNGENRGSKAIEITDLGDKASKSPTWSERGSTVKQDCHPSSNLRASLDKCVQGNVRSWPQTVFAKEPYLMGSFAGEGQILR